MESIYLISLEVLLALGGQSGLAEAVVHLGSVMVSLLTNTGGREL